MVDKNKQPTEFSVTYAGDALDNNLMGVKDLAPALLSLGQAFERANTLLNGDRATVNLNIKALSPGSFGISLVLFILIYYSKYQTNVNRKVLTRFQNFGKISSISAIS